MDVSRLTGRSTSSRRYKQDIIDLKFDPCTILDLKPCTWRDKGEVERNPDTDRWHVGYIAEELDDIELGVFMTTASKGGPSRSRKTG